MRTSEHLAGGVHGSSTRKTCLPFRTAPARVSGSSVSITHSKHKGRDLSLDAKRAFLAP